MTPFIVHYWQEYFAFCERYNNGVYLHHDPSMQDVPNRYYETWKGYVGLFGTLPNDKSIWPDPEVESEEEYDYDDMGCG